MGKIFIQHPGGSRLYSCANCDTVLTNRSELISTRFTGSTGRAFLFHKVENLTMSECQDRVMLTGPHIVRDVSCKNCKVINCIYYRFSVLFAEDKCAIVIKPLSS